MKILLAVVEPNNLHPSYLTAHSLHFEIRRRPMLRIARNCSGLVGYSNVSKRIVLRWSISIILTARLLLPLAVLAEGDTSRCS